MTTHNRLKQCKHENADHLKRGDLLEVDGAVIDVARCEQFRCVDCAAWLPLGQSNDAPEEVRREIALATCIADWCQVWETGPDRDEVIERYIDGFVSQPIATHDERGGR